jgi:ribosome-binding ATPase
MQIGIVGAPNKGKSTIFSALTMVEAEIAPYPFTTIKPNVGMAYATRACVEKELGVKCAPRNSLCINGVRHMPVGIVDVAGLVPGAHLGKGMGNQFLNDLIGADMLIHVVDLSGRTDAEGNPGEGFDPADEVRMVHEEMTAWLSGIVMKHIKSLSRKSGDGHALFELLSGFNVGEAQIKRAAELSSLSVTNMAWTEEDAKRFADALLRTGKPTIIAANKLDISREGALDALRGRLKGFTVIGCSGAIELALKRAGSKGLIDYVPGSSGFVIRGDASADQRNALSYMADYIKKNGGTGVQDVINTAVFKVLNNVVVYPVEDENKYTDHFGNVLPDAILMKRGSRAMDLAGRIHTDLAKSMLYAIDARKKMRLGKDYELRDDDVIRIVSAAK